MSKPDVPINNILSFRRPDEVSKFLESLDKTKYSWENVGKDETNFRQLAFSRSGLRAIIERITNSIDSILENRRELRKDAEDAKISSPREAIEKWFGCKGGHISFLDEKERRKIAQDSIQVILDDSGVETRPTVTVVDRGIGIHPDDFHKTIVGLGGSLKRGKLFLLGAYGWGGSQTFAWCNGALESKNIESLPLALIVSRKNPELLTGGQRDEVGWTIVRYKDNPNEKHGVFQYLVDSEGDVPRTSPKNLPKDFTHGTQIIHLAYNLERFHGRMTLASYRIFQSMLFDPILPFWLYDNRHGEGRTISGNLSRLGKDDKKLVEYQNTINQEMSFGTVKIRYWVLKAEKDGSLHIDSYIERPGSSNTVFTTLNGQQYGTLSKQIIKDSGFAFLSDYIIFHIECDNLPNHSKKSVFPSTREDIREEYKDAFRNEIISILQNDEELKRLEEARKLESLKSGDEESIKRVRRLLDKLIIVNKKIVKGGGGQGTKKKRKKFKPKDPPTKLQILPNKIEIVPGEEKKIAVETDAPDDYLTRDKDPGSIECSIDNPNLKCRIRSGFLRDGRINFYIVIDKNVPIGTKGKLVCKLTSRATKLEDSREVESVHPMAPLPSNYPPTIFQIINEENPLNIKRGKKSLIQIRCDGPDGMLENPEGNAKLQLSFLPDIGIKVTGISDLVRHRIRVFLNCPDSVEAGKRTEVFCRLSIPNQSTFSTQRPCIVVQPPPGSGEGGGGSDIEIPLYDIQPVEPDDDNWVRFQWNETNVGKYMKSGDTLVLYISLGNKHYLNNLERTGLTAERVEALKEKYLAYLAFHLWLMQEDSSKKNLNDEQIEEEMNRICQTVLLSLDQLLR